MRPTPRYVFPFILFVCALAFACLTTSCKGLSASLGNGMKGLPVVAIVELQGPEGTTPGWALYDGETLIAYNGDFVGRALLVDKASLVTIGIVEFTASGQLALKSKKRDFSQKFATGESLPAWVTENYPMSLLEQYGVIVEGVTPAATAALIRSRPYPNRPVSPTNPNPAPAKPSGPTQVLPH